MDIINKIFDNKLTLEDQEEALKSPYTAYKFARYVPGANIERCQEIACKSVHFAYMFAKDISGANIEKCQEVVLKHPTYAYHFAKFVPGASIRKCIEVCKETKWEAELNTYLMQKALE